jgi:hypothetical protein
MNDVLVIDDFLDQSELNHINDHLIDKVPWIFVDDTGISKGRYRTLGHSRQLDKCELIDPEINLIIKVQEFNDLNPDIFDEKFDFHTIYYNAIRYGDKFKYHTDGTGPTFLIYCNKDWRWWYGGGTKIKGYGTVKPKPGRLVIFPGNIKHKPCPMSFLTQTHARFSIALQSNKTTTP